MSKTTTHVLSLPQCGYCESPIEGDHTCPQGEAGRAKLAAIVASIHAMMERPGSDAVTSEQLRIRADRRQSYATGVRASGGDLTEAYK